MVIGLSVVGTAELGVGWAAGRTRRTNRIVLVAFGHGLLLKEYIYIPINKSL